MLAEELAPRLGRAILVEALYADLAQWADWFAASACSRFQDDASQVRRSCLYAATCWRESRGGRVLVPRGPGGVGDDGHAFGLMQIDVRYHAQFIASVGQDGVPLWKVPRFNIDYGAGILEGGLLALSGVRAGAQVREVEVAAACAYNASLDRVRAIFAAGGDPDRITTKGVPDADGVRHPDYGEDVVSHADIWTRRILAAA